MVYDITLLAVLAVFHCFRWYYIFFGLTAKGLKSLAQTPILTLSVFEVSSPMGACRGWVAFIIIIIHIFVLRHYAEASAALERSQSGGIKAGVKKECL